KLFGQFEGSPKAVPQNFTNPNFHSGLYVKEKDIEQSHIAISYPGVSLKDTNYYSFVAFNNILGGNMSSRLFQEVREEKGLAYSIFSYQSCYTDVGSITIYGSTSNQQLPTLQETILQSLERVKKEGITVRELENAKEQMKGSFVLSQESSTNRMSRNGKNEFVHGYHATIDEVLERIDKVSMDSLNKLIENILQAEPANAIIGQGINQLVKK